MMFSSPTVDRRVVRRASKRARQQSNRTGLPGRRRAPLDLIHADDEQP